MQQPLTVNGKPPLNDFGTCFDAAAHNFIAKDNRDATTRCRARLCHGIGVANFPGQEGQAIAHAWIEFDHNDGSRLAFDPIWGILQHASIYRERLQVSYVVEYRRKIFITLWKARKFSGPYDREIMKYTAEGKRGSI